MHVRGKLGTRKSRSTQTQEGWPSSMPELTAARRMDSPGIAGNGTKKITGISSQTANYTHLFYLTERLMLPRKKIPVENSASKHFT